MQSADQMAKALVGTPAAELTRSVGESLNDAITGKNALSYETILAAANGNEDARQQVVEHSLGAAMAGIQGVKGKAKPKPKAKDLPMDEASRMARAKEMGFDVEQTLFHGTKDSFEQFNPEMKKPSSEYGIFFSPDSSIASSYAGYDEIFPSEKIGNVMPVYLRIKNPKVVDFAGSKYGRKEAIESAIKGGHDGVIFKNHYDAGGIQDQYVVFDPSQIRSKFAEFDPKKAKSGNISAALGAATIGTGGLAASQESQAADTIRMHGPDGKIRDIPIALKGEAIASGGKVVK